MPDENKFAKLREIGYTITPCCGLCKHKEADFQVPLWGHCQHPSTQYQHGKHSDPTHPLGVHSLGHCKYFELDPVRVQNHLQSYGCFLQVEPPK